MGELVIRKNNLDLKNNNENNQISINFLKNKNFNLEQVERYFSTLVNSYNEIKQNINPEEIYVVKFTQE